MQQATLHSFHIPVMGLSFTVDSPVKVARYGISSVASITDDHLLEEMRRIYCEKTGRAYVPIEEDAHDSRALRTEAYLNLMHELVQEQVEALKQEDFETGAEINKFFDLLAAEHPVRQRYEQMLATTDPAQKAALQVQLREDITPGYIDVNIMTKLDKINYDKDGNELPREYSDALAALRGFAKSKVDASVVFSAGMNPALFAYTEQFSDFFPTAEGKLRKRIILKVSDYRSALLQGKMLAKRGLWVSEFRIESGLNCGGHAFATDGVLIGPILEEFKQNRESLGQQLLDACQQVLTQKGLPLLPADLQPRITYQGGIGTAAEDRFLMEYYHLDGTGWGSPFLLVPEATTVDDDTLNRINAAKVSDFYLSYASPLGVPFNNLRTSTGEEQRITRIEKNRPGSPCYKKFLQLNTEFTQRPICLGSREYQNLKVKQHEAGEISAIEKEDILLKDCLCEGLAASGRLCNGQSSRRKLDAVTICPGPNLAYFKGVFSLKEMVDHIYGKINLKLNPERPHVFAKELQLYVDYLKADIARTMANKPAKYDAYVQKFQKNLQEGIRYYQELLNSQKIDSDEVIEKMKQQIQQLGADFQEVVQQVLQPQLVMA